MRNHIRIFVPYSTSCKDYSNVHLSDPKENSRRDTENITCSKPTIAWISGISSSHNHFHFFP